MNVSVCIPTYNQAPYIEQAIRSVFNQTYSPYEIIVCDDCSTDNTNEILKCLAKEISILKIVRQPQNLGISRNTDFCLRLASGDLVLRLDSDDYLLPVYLFKLVALLNQNPTAGYAHAAVQEIDKDGNFLKKRWLARKSNAQSGLDALKASVKGYRVAANIILFRKKALEEVGYIAAKTNFAEDYYLSASLAAAGFGNVYLNEILSCYRVWLDTGKVRQRRKLVEIIGFRKVFEEVLEPAFKQRDWKLSILKKRRTIFVCNHAVCLAWDIYTKNEKTELVGEFYKMSASFKAKLFVWLYLNGFGNVINIYNKTTSLPKILFKNIYLLIKAK